MMISLPIPQSKKTATLDYIHIYSFESYLNTITINKRITINQEGKPTKIIQRPTRRQRADKTRHRSKSEKVLEKIIIFTYYY